MSKGFILSLAVVCFGFSSDAFAQSGTMKLQLNLNTCVKNAIISSANLQDTSINECVAASKQEYYATSGNVTMPSTTKAVAAATNSTSNTKVFSIFGKSIAQNIATKWNKCVSQKTRNKCFSCTETFFNNKIKPAFKSLADIMGGYDDQALSDAWELLHNECFKIYEADSTGICSGN